MYINFKSKYKKIIWILIGFMCACFFIDKVNALDDTSNGFYIKDLYIDNTLINNLWEEIEGKTAYQAGFNYSGSSYTVDNSYILKKENYNYMYIESTPSTSTDKNVSIYFLNFDLNECNLVYSHGAYSCNLSHSYDILRFWFQYNTSTNSYNSPIKETAIKQSSYYRAIFYPPNDRYVVTNFSFDLYYNDSILYNQSFVYSTIPSYLNGYTKISLTTEDRYYMLSGLSTGSIFVPLDSFLSSGGRLSYYDNDLSSQPYTSYIQDYTTTPDYIFARQDFDLSSYNGADFVMFSKYIYLEGEDNISYDIWVPNDITYSDVTITPNSSGGNDFSFQYKDSNGDIQNETASTVDLTPLQPLLSDVFTNFTTNYYGLSSIITSPIAFLQSLNNATCTPLNIPSPIGDNSFTIPCMTSIYETYGGDFFTLYQTITTGFIAYYVGLGYFNLIKGLKDPSDDRIEVIHL